MSNFLCSCAGIIRLVQYLSSYLFHQFKKNRFEKNAFKVFDNKKFEFLDNYSCVKLFCLSRTIQETFRFFERLLLLNLVHHVSYACFFSASSSYTVVQILEIICLLPLHNDSINLHFLSELFSRSYTVANSLRNTFSRAKTRLRHMCFRTEKNSFVITAKSRLLAVYLLQ